jgi:hypothetical protein
MMRVSIGKADLAGKMELLLNLGVVIRQAFRQ